jgi:hypothetical protein
VYTHTQSCIERVRSFSLCRSASNHTIVLIGNFPFDAFYFDNNNREKETRITILSRNIELEE